MNKIGILFIVLHVSFAVSFSQSKKDTIRENYIGFSGGITSFSTFTDIEFVYENQNANGERILESPYMNGWAAGISYKNFKERLVGIHLELNYIKKGGYNEFHEDINGNETDIILFQHTLEYAELPFMMNLRFGWEKLKFNFYGGPHIAWLFDQEIIILEETFGSQFKDRADFNFEFGVNGGGGISFQIGDHHMFEVGVRYSHGITNIFRFDTINNAVFNQNQVISGRAHYYYRF